MKKIILTFESVHFVIQAEKILLENKIPHEVIHTPRSISSDCGVCVLIEYQYLQRAQKLITDKNVTVNVYERGI